MNYKKNLFIFVLIMFISLSLIGCGGGKSHRSGPTGNPKPAVFWSSEYGKQLGWGENVSVSGFNSKASKYTMVVVPPSYKPESNSGPTKFFSFTIEITDITNSIHPTTNFYNNGMKQLQAQISTSKMTNFDILLREKENQILAKRPSQKGIMASTLPTRTFNINDDWNDIYIVDTGNTIDAKCIEISDHAYYFVDTRDTTTWNSAKLAPYVIAFESIYNINHIKFGLENDVDSNNRVIIIFSQELKDNLLGYFYAADKFSQSSFSDSNQGDIFYITTQEYASDRDICATLAHEFQHMIYFDQHYNRGVTNTYTWLNEALSQAAEYYNHYDNLTDNHMDWINTFLDDNWGGLSLTHWTKYNYGYGAIFIRYLIDQYGDAAIKNMCSTDKVGIAAVEAATGVDFNTIFVNFSRAVVLSGLSDASSDSIYQFSTLDLRTIQPVGRKGLETSYSFNAGDIVSGTGIPPYSINFLRWQGSFGNAKLSGNFIEGTFFGISQ